MHFRYPLPRLLLWVVTIAVFGACEREQVGRADRHPEDLPTPASASLLRRVAGIADAFRTGDTIFIVVSDSFPHPVFGVFPDSTSAAAAADSAGPTYGVLRTLTPPPTEGPDVDAIILPGCWKNKYTTEFICPLFAKYILRDSVAEIALTIRTTGGDSLVVTVPNDSVAAFILTLDGYDKFIVPYYTSVFGVEYVADQRLDLVAALDDLATQQ